MTYNNVSNGTYKTLSTQYWLSRLLPVDSQHCLIMNMQVAGAFRACMGNMISERLKGDSH